MLWFMFVRRVLQLIYAQLVLDSSLTTVHAYLRKLIVWVKCCIYTEYIGIWRCNNRVTSYISSSCASQRVTIIRRLIITTTTSLRVYWTNTMKLFCNSLILTLTNSSPFVIYTHGRGKMWTKMRTITTKTTIVELKITTTIANADKRDTLLP